MRRNTHAGDPHAVASAASAASFKRGCVHEWSSARLVGHSYLIRLLQGCPLFARNTQRNLFREGFDRSGGFDPSNQAERHHEKDGSEARGPKNVGDGPVFACSIHEDAAQRQGSHNQEIPRCGCGIKQDSETPATCPRWDSHSISEIQREELIEDVDGESHCCSSAATAFSVAPVVWACDHAALPTDSELIKHHIQALFIEISLCV